LTVISRVASSCKYAVFSFLIDPPRETGIPVGVAVWSPEQHRARVRFVKEGEPIEGLDVEEHLPFVRLVQQKVERWLETGRLPHGGGGIPSEDAWWQHLRALLIHQVRLSEAKPLRCSDLEQEVEELYRREVHTGFRAGIRRPNGKGSTSGALPFVIDNRQHRLADVLNDLLGLCEDRPFDVATAYFSIAGYRLLQDGLHRVGAFRLLIGSDPHTGADVGLRPNQKALEARLRGDLEAEPFTPATLRLVEELIAFLRAENVQVRLYSKGFLHAKAYLFHQDRVGPDNRADRCLPFAAVVGSSNFTASGLTSNRELNLVHRVFLPDEEAQDPDAAKRVAYLEDPKAPAAHMADVAPGTRRLIRSEVGARVVMDLTRWYEEQWAESVDFREDLIQLLDASKFGTKEYTPYEVYVKALYEYFREELGEEAPELGRSAVDLAEFQEDAVRKARRILARYDGVLIADSVGLGKTWIGKKLLEDFAYHRRQRAVVVCPASLRVMWQRELASATIAAQVVGMEEMGRTEFDPAPIGDADVVLIDESHNFRNDKSNRYLALDAVIQRNGGRGRDGSRKKVILLSATPINNDLYDLASQLRLLTQSQPDYFREAGIGDLTAYFRRARKLARQEGASAGVLLFNLLEEIMVRNTRPYIRAAYPNATIKGKPVAFPDRRLHTVTYDLGKTYGGLYGDIVRAIDQLSLAPYQLEAYKKKSAIRDEQQHEWEAGREMALVGIFKTRFLKRLESSIEAFRLSLRRALTFEETYRDYLLEGKVVSSKDFQRALRFLARDEEDDVAAGSVADELDSVAEARAYIEDLPTADLNQYDLPNLTHDVEADVKLLKGLYDRTEQLAEQDGKLEKLKDLLAGDLKGRKVLIFSSFRDTARYLHRRLTGEGCAAWRRSAGNPTIRKIDSGNHPDERGHILGLFAPVANERTAADGEGIDVLVSTDVLSEGQNLQDCGVLINYDLTWNPIRLIQRSGRIDRIGSPHPEIGIYNLFPEAELEDLLHLVERLTGRIAMIDDLGLLDASVLSEVVHPRTFNALRRIREQDGAVLDEEEARAELAGPEALLKDLKGLLNRDGTDTLSSLPNGIHSGLRREKCNGTFFYFQAPRSDGGGKRHFWRYIDARSHEINENRYEIAQTIACLPDEPRYIGDQDVFALQEKVIEDILSTEREAEARAAAPTTVDPIQQTVTEELKDAIRRRTADRDLAKRCLTFLGQPMGRALHVKLRSAYESWSDARDDNALLAAVALLADQFGKERPMPSGARRLQREDLELICFDHVST
jgi:superfamily II DNA or RNA helicase